MLIWRLLLAGAAMSSGNLGARSGSVLSSGSVPGHQPIISATWDSDVNSWIYDQYTVTRLQNNIGVHIETNWNANYNPLVKLYLEVNDVPFPSNSAPYSAPPSYVKGIASGYTHHLIYTLDPNQSAPVTIDTTVRTQLYSGPAPIVYLRLVGYDAAGAVVWISRYAKPVAICYAGAPVPIEPVFEGSGHGPHRRWWVCFGM